MIGAIGLGEFIAKVKEDLKPTEESPMFFIEKIDLEIHVTATKEVSLEGGIEGKADIKINVLGLDLLKLGEGGFDAQASSMFQHQDTHTIKVTLTPILEKKDIVSTLGEEDLRQIKEGLRQKIMRGAGELAQLDLNSTEKKIMRG